MRETWNEIVEYFRQKRQIGDGEFQAALSGVEQVARLIADEPLNFGLYGWTAMHDLCIQQTDAAPYSGPYLRISPLPSGSVEFRYADTRIIDRQWHRLEPANKATHRFTAFLKQLHWAVLD